MEYSRDGGVYVITLHRRLSAIFEETSDQVGKPQELKNSGQA